MKPGKHVLYDRDGHRIVVHEPGYWLAQLEALAARLLGTR